MVPRTDQNRARLRSFSKAVLKRWYRIEVAAEVARQGDAPFNPTSLVEAMANRVPLNKVSDELNFLVEVELLKRHETPSPNNEFVRNASAFWEMAVALEAELLEH